MKLDSLGFINEHCTLNTPEINKDTSVNIKVLNFKVAISSIQKALDHAKVIIKSEEKLNLYNNVPIKTRISLSAFNIPELNEKLDISDNIEDRLFEAGLIYHNEKLNLSDSVDIESFIEQVNKRNDKLCGGKVCIQLNYGLEDIDSQLDVDRSLIDCRDGSNKLIVLDLKNIKNILKINSEQGLGNSIKWVDILMKTILDKVGDGWNFTISISDGDPINVFMNTGIISLLIDELAIVAARMLKYNEIPGEIELTKAIIGQAIAFKAEYYLLAGLIYCMGMCGIQENEKTKFKTYKTLVKVSTKGDIVPSIMLRFISVGSIKKDKLPIFVVGQETQLLEYEGELSNFKYIPSVDEQEALNSYYNEYKRNKLSIIGEKLNKDLDSRLVGIILADGYNISDLIKIQKD